MTENQLTLKDLRKAMSLIKSNEYKVCQGKHDYNITGWCYWCNKLWLGKEDKKNLDEYFNFKGV